MIKAEKFTTDEGSTFEISIGDYTGRLLIDTDNNTLQFSKKEVKELINILFDYYERLD
jgi:hypothetical protein